MLFSGGCSNAKAFLEKMVEVFLLSKQLLSVQVHYDWGLRPLKSILTGGGGLISAEKAEHFAAVDEAKERGAEPPNGRIGELDFGCELVTEARRVNTWSEVTSLDARSFKELVDASFFPKIKIAEFDYATSIEKVREVRRTG